MNRIKRASPWFIIGTLLCLASFCVNVLSSGGTIRSGDRDSWGPAWSWGSEDSNDWGGGNDSGSWDWGGGDSGSWDWGGGDGGSWDSGGGDSGSW